MSQSPYNQSGFAIRCEWGLQGLTVLATSCDVLVIIDVLSFTTCVDVVVSQQCSVIPTALRGTEIAVFAESEGAIVAAPRSVHMPSLSPASLVRLKAGTRLVLPSLNGSALSAVAPDGRTLSACLRNRSAVARAAGANGRTIGIVPAGERWPDGSLRPAYEDLVAAGAVIERLPGTRSPEAAAAEAAWRDASTHLPQALAQASSGRELIQAGFGADVDLAAEVDVSIAVPWLVNSTFMARSK